VEIKYWPFVGTKKYGIDSGGVLLELYCVIGIDFINERTRTGKIKQF
jgi:hypothetical protein